MGIKKHRFQTLQELCDIYPSPKVVQERLLKTLYENGIPDSIVERFHKYSVKETENGGFHWTESTYTAFLANSYSALDENAWSQIAPVLYRIILHHGSNPFKPTKDATISLENLAIAVSLLTANDRALQLANPDPYELQGQLRREALLQGTERSYNWTDRLRLLFQSLCDTDWAKRGAENCRGAGDDEDLVAVLFASMPETPDDPMGRFSWRRDRKLFLPVAATLPSSHSRKLDGRVAVADVGALLKVLVVAGAMERNVMSADAVGGVDDAVKGLLGALGSEDGYIGWEAFSKGIGEAMPFLLTDLDTLFRTQFNIEANRDYYGASAAHSWEIPPAITGTDDQSQTSFLSGAQVLQLGLAAGRSSIYGFSLLHQSKPGQIQTSDMQTLLSTASPGRLFIIRATIDPAGKNEPLVLVTKLRWQSWDQWERYLKRNDPYWIPRMYADCFVQLSPQHRLVKGSFDKARVDVGTADNTLSIHVGGASLWFENGLTKGSLSDGVETVHFVPDLFEIWTGPGAAKAKRLSREVFSQDPHILYS